MDKNEYQCYNCKNIYQKGWSDEEQKKEAEEIFGKPVDEWKDEPVVVCDDCFNKMHPKDNPELVEKAKKIL